MKKISAVFLAVFILMLSGCGAPYYEDNIFAMDTIMTIKAYGDNSESAVKKAAEAIDGLDKKLSISNESSEIYALNNSSGKTVSVSSETAGIIRKALYYSMLTDGALDITVYPLVREWGFTTGNYNIPDSERINELLAYVGYEKIDIDENEITLSDGQMIDLGAVAKGYAGDVVREILSENGISSAVINLGGNVAVIGKKSDGNEWNIAVTDPFSPDGYICSIRVSDKSVVTSGDYQRYFTADDGTRYCHIIDPKTGCPAKSGIVSATIIGENGLMCDALSTAVFVMGAERAEEFWRRTGGFGMILVESDGGIIVTDNVAGHITYFGETEKRVRVIER